MAAVPEVKTRMTATEFFDLPETNLPTELIEGVLYEMPAPLPNHQILSMKLIAILLQIVKGGQLLHSPIDVYLDEDNVVQPDILWIAPESKCEIGRTRLIGAPDFIIEILSSGTSRRDKREKFNLYQKHGVREYWLVDPANEYIEVYTLKDGKFESLGVFGAGETIPSPLLGNIELKDIF